MLYVESVLKIKYQVRKRKKETEREREREEKQTNRIKKLNKHFVRFAEILENV